MNTGLQAKHLTKQYSGSKVLAVSNLNLTIPSGEIFGFVGPNGAGKSTALKIFSTLLLPTKGTVQVAGFDTVKQSSEVRKNIGVVFQNNSLDLNLTVEENFRCHAVLHTLTYPALTFNRCSPAYQKRVQELLTLFELQGREHDLVKTLSGGLQRRVDIAKALLHIPKLLFLDEPTVGLDPHSRRALWKYLKELHSRHRFTLFLTTQYLEETELCNRIGIINQGRIVALDTPSNLKASLPLKSKQPSLDDVFLYYTQSQKVQKK